MKDADPPPILASTAEPARRKPWSTPVVMVSSRVGDATGSCAITQSAGQVERKISVTTGSTTVIS